MMRVQREADVVVERRELDGIPTPPNPATISPFTDVDLLMC